MTKLGISVHPLLFIIFLYVAWVTRLAALPFIDPPKAAFFSHLFAGTLVRLMIWCLLPAFWIIVVERRTMVSALYPVEGRSVRLAWLAAVFIAALMLVGMRVTRGHWLLFPSGRLNISRLLERSGFSHLERS